MKLDWRQVFVGLAVGLLAGALAGRMQCRRHHQRMKQRFAAKLQLTDEQKSKIETIMREHRQKANEELRKVLTPEQLPKFEELEARRRKREEKR